MGSLQTLITAMPKAELHMHLEGSIEPDLMFKLAARNRIKLRYESEAALQAAYNFTNLQSFLDVYYAGLTVLLEERDFYDMTAAYLARVHDENVVHTEVFISPQAHTRRGVSFGAMLEGIDSALKDGERRFGITTRLIVGLQRQWSEDDAFAMVESTKPYRDRITGLGLGGPEVGNPPQKFTRVFEHARALGWKTVAHAGEEGPAAYVADTIEFLKVDRVDHGVRCEEDPSLVARLAEQGIPLTVCPISNVKLRVFPDLASHNLKRLLEAGVCVTINSDDPSYFLGYMNDNYLATQEALSLSRDQIHQIARNGFDAAFLDALTRERYLAMVDRHFSVD
ncbi:MAG: adenosine deaminase [Burkholderiales bacterium]